MDLPAAQDEFLSLLRKIPDAKTLREFRHWIKNDWLQDAMDEDISEEPDNCTAILHQIAADLREKLPLEAQLPSETIMYSKIGPNQDVDPHPAFHVDAFLYDDDLVDELCDTGKLPRNYCLSCGSKNTKPLTFISHSTSKENLARIFNDLLPALDGRTLLDVGSRLGAVLFGAFVYSSARKIIGIEINPDLCALSTDVVKKYAMESRIEVIAGDVRHHAGVVAAADVIFMNNVFEFFAPPDVQRELWSFLYRTIKPGTLLVSMPPVEESLSALGTDINVGEWVEGIGSLPTCDPDQSDGGPCVPETNPVHLYRVRER